MLTTYTIDPDQTAQACVIWLHGLGADGANMMGVVDAFPKSNVPIRHVFVDAPVRPVTLNNHMPMRAWYDITGTDLRDRQDREGILASEQQIEAIITDEMSKGFSPKNIYIAGFSQGGAMALFIAMRTQQSLGGVMALSAYLPLQTDCSKGNQLSLPIFMAVGLQDQVVLPAWTTMSYEFVRSRGFSKVSLKEYDMEHQICMDEITDISHWLEAQIAFRSLQGDVL